MGVAVPAAGSGVRMGGRKKAFLELRGEPLLLHALRPFLAHPDVISVVVAVAPDDADSPPAWLGSLDPRVRVVAGGATRLHSVLGALEAVSEEAEIAVVHDAARPLVTRATIDRCIAVARSGEGGVAGWPSTDTLKEVDDSLRVVATPPREAVWRAHTPQAFPRATLLEAYREAVAGGMSATDDAAVFAGAGGAVRMVKGDRWNLKVTHPDDVGVAEFLMDVRTEVRTDVRTGVRAGGLSPERDA